MVKETMPSSRASSPVTRPARISPSPLAGSAMASSRSATLSLRVGRVFTGSTYRAAPQRDKRPLEFLVERRSVVEPAKTGARVRFGSRLVYARPTAFGRLRVDGAHGASLGAIAHSYGRLR